ncbi:MAG: 6-phosphogluconolactonase [Defluviitaleaceae bacterium]|nr:6-phosphogluconolactonase [Defluviitaleaceae bacterium]
MEKLIEVEYRVYPDPDALAKAAASHLMEIAMKSVAEKGCANIAVSGGNTPKNMFAQLAVPTGEYYSAMPWPQLQLFFVDERMVPPDDQDSNYNMTREAMLGHVPLTPEQVTRIKGELIPEEAAFQYESAIRSRLGLQQAELPGFDVVQLGMGDDGHTASLFPHTDALHERHRIAVANYVPQKSAWRVTLTKTAINNAAEVFFLIGGKDKAEPLRRVLQDPYEPSILPSQLIQPNNDRLLFLLDGDAAARLPATDANGVGRISLRRYPKLSID